MCVTDAYFMIFLRIHQVCKLNFSNNHFKSAHLGVVIFIACKNADSKSLKTFFNPPSFMFPSTPFIPTVPHFSCVQRSRRNGKFFGRSLLLIFNPKTSLLATCPKNSYLEVLIEGADLFIRAEEISLAS